MPKEITFDELQNINQKCVVIIRSGRIGDIVACEPVVGYASKKFPAHKIVWILRKSFISTMIAHPKIDYLIDYEKTNIRDLLEFLQMNRDSMARINLNPARTYCFLTKTNLTSKSNPDSQGLEHHKYGSLLEGFTRAAGIPPLKEAPIFHLTEKIDTTGFPQSGYVTFHCSSSDKVRDWGVEKWIALLEYFRSTKTPVVEVGKSPILSGEPPYYYPVRGKDTIQLSAKLIQKSFFFFGIDSGFAHIANALKVNGVIIMGKLGKFQQRQVFTGLYNNCEYKIYPQDRNHQASAVELKNVVELFKRKIPNYL